MKACKVDEEKLAGWIDGATGAIRYLGPALTEKLAQKILAAEKRTGERCHVVIDLDDEMDRCGYGQTAGVRTLHNERAPIHRQSGLRIGALSAPGIGVVWSPIAERVDPIDRVSVNGIWMEGPEQRELLRWISRMMGEQETSQSVSDLDRRDMPASLPEAPSEPDLGPLEGIDRRRQDAAGTEGTAEFPVHEAVHHGPAPSEPDLAASAVQEQDLKEAELHLREHPPRDFRKEKETEVYQDYVGFIEIHVIGASLAESTTLAIPNELTELGLETDLRTRLSETMRIDLSDRVDLGARDVNRRVDAFREIFTKQMGPPLGRVYKKSEWDIIQIKWAEIERLVEMANEKIERSMDKAVDEIIADAAAGWANAIAENPRANVQRRYTAHDIRSMLGKQWDQRKRAKRMRVQLFVKDFTWATLNDPEVRCKIEQAYPDIRETGLYKSRSAWAS